MLPRLHCNEKLRIRSKAKNMELPLGVPLRYCCHRINGVGHRGDPEEAERLLNQSPDIERIFGKPHVHLNGSHGSVLGSLGQKRSPTM